MFAILSQTALFIEKLWSTKYDVEEKENVVSQGHISQTGFANNALKIYIITIFFLILYRICTVLNNKKKCNSHTGLKKNVFVYMFEHKKKKKNLISEFFWIDNNLN